MKPTHDASLLRKAQPYTNPQHQVDSDNLAAHDKALAETQDQGGNDNAASQQPSHNWEKRYKDLQSYNSREINRLKGELADSQKQGVQPITLPKTPEELAAFKAQNGETYAIIETMAAQISQTQMSQYDSKLATVTGDLMDTKIERAQLAIKQAHPDFEQLIENDQFHDWAAKQTTEVQDWIYNNPDEPQKAIRAISLYKYELGQTKSTQTNTATHGGDLDIQPKNHADPTQITDRSHPAYIWRESEISRMRPEEFSKWDESITLAQREGRIIFGQ